MRRCLFVSLSPALGGAERSMLLLARELPAAGWTPVLACLPGELSDYARRQGVEVIETSWRTVEGISETGRDTKRYPLARVAAGVGDSARNAALLRRTARDGRVDVIVSNSFHAHPFVVLGGRLARRPVVWHLRDMVSPGPGQRALSAIGRLAAAVISNSAAVAATVPHRSGRVIVNPIEIAPSAGPPPEWAGEDPVVGFLGRLDPRKGLEDLIDAAPSIPARIVVVGRPLMAPEGYLDGLRARAEAVAPGRVAFVGPVADPATALAGFDILAVTSLREPWGRVAAEAICLGVPVVASAGGGLPEIVEDGVTGLLYPPGNVAALAHAVGELLADPVRRRAMGDAGRARASRFDPQVHAREVARLLEEVTR